MLHVFEALPEYRHFQRLTGQMAGCDPVGGAAYRLAVERCLADLMLGNIERGEAAALLDAARGRLSSGTVGRDIALRMRLEGLLDSLEGVLLGRLLDAALSARPDGREAA